MSAWRSRFKAAAPVVLFAVGATLLLGVTPSNAAYSLYCNVLVPPTTNCADASGGSYVGGVYYANEAYYPGSGTVSVCERANYQSGGAQVSRRCANNDVGSAQDLYYSCDYHL